MVSPTSNPIAISRPNPLSLPLSSPRLANNGFNPSSPSSPSLWSHLSPNNAMSPSCRSDSMLYPYWANSNNGENHPHFHRRSASFNDMYYGTDDSTSGFGFKPCLYYAKGNCLT
ncbi:unnamed protein product [Amaranthus hypochondriacus]